MLFASARDGAPKITVVLFTLSEEAGSLNVNSQRLSCPGDCTPPVSVIGLGEHDAADQFLDAHPMIYQSGGPALAIRSAIEAQANGIPQYVSLPSTVVLMDAQGIREVRN
jgi:hypothetical protein